MASYHDGTHSYGMRGIPASDAGSSFIWMIQSDILICHPMFSHGQGKRCQVWNLYTMWLALEEILNGEGLGLANGWIIKSKEVCLGRTKKV